MAECMTMSLSATAKPSASCLICTSNFDEFSDMAALPCGHVFHSHCAGEWFKQSQTCPQCRRRLRNPQKDQLKIYLSFGDQENSSEDRTGDGAELPGLAELRAKLAEVTKEQELAKQQVRRSKQRDLMMKRDLSQKKRQLDEYTTQLRSCQESLAQQESENCQLMQLLAQEYEQMSDEARKLRAQLDEEGLVRKRLEGRLHQLEARNADQKRNNARMLDQLQDSQQEVIELMDSLEIEKSRNMDLADKILAVEAESFQLSKRLNSFHLATRHLLLSEAGANSCKKTEESSFGSLPILPIVGEAEIRTSDHSIDGVNAL
ncbi:hypothetical protein BOX15_Mlig003178g2 [Macrostomum lignano]|uniref:RING-type E3 ubiquitin transferase n=1 Tax=Macrostomum lignano TaxID=282301 RepID=A0A267DR82_9PLAT|nr:hypothetical protein BOX15_Mlig003178g2 [Macrostomum lignano]